jgi:hypothetical protein
MALFKLFETTLTDRDGNVLVGATITVTEAVTGFVPVIYSNRDGTAQLPSNVATSDAYGLVRFYVADGFYNLKQESANYSVTFNGVQIGSPLDGHDAAATITDTDKVLMSQGGKPVVATFAQFQGSLGNGLTDGDKVDITVSSAGQSWVIKALAVITSKIADKAVTLAKMADLTGPGTIGRTSAGAGGLIALTWAQVKSALGLVKADVGLSSVDNTADTDKPVSAPQASALAPKNSPVFTGPVTINGPSILPLVTMATTVIDVTVGRQRYPAAGNSALTFSATPVVSTVLRLVIDATSASTITIPNCIDKLTGAVIASVAVAAGARREILLEWDGANYRISDYADAAGVGVTDGDKVDITVSSGGTSWVIKAAAVITSKIAGGAVTLAKMANMASAGVLGNTASGAAPAVLSFSALKTAMAFVKGDVGLGNVDNTADTNKPVSTDQANTLAPKIAPVFSGVVTSPGATVAPIQTMAGTVIDVTQGRQIYNASGNATLTFSATPLAGTAFLLIVQATAESVITIAGMIDVTTGSSVPSFTVGAGIRREVLFDFDGTSYRISNYTDGGVGVSDGDKADVVVSGAGLIWTIKALAVSTGKLAAKAVTIAKIADLTGPGTIGRSAAGAGAVSELTWGQVKTAIGLANADNTADANKPVSGPQQTALDNKVDETSGTASNLTMTGVSALQGATQIVRTNTAGNVLNIAIPNKSTITGPTGNTFVLSGTIPDGQAVDWMLINGTASDVTITIPSCYSQAAGAQITTFVLKSNDVREILITKADATQMIYGEQQPPANTGATFGAYETIAAGATVDLGTVTSLNVSLTGTATVTSFGTVHPVTKFVTLAGSSNFTKSATMVIEGDDTFNGSPGDSFVARSTSAGNWRIDHISRADGENVSGFIPTQTVTAGTTTALKNGKGKNVAINGNTAITGFGNAANGTTKFVVMINSPTIAHLGAGATGPITCPGSKDIQAQQGDTFTAVCESNAWTITDYMRKTGESLNGFLASQNVASGSGTADLCAVNTRIISLTGSGTVTSFGVSPVAAVKFVTVNSTPSLTNGTNLVLPNNENIVCRAGDTFIASTSDGTIWTMMFYQRKDGQPLRLRLYDGVLSGLPAASGRPVGELAIIDEPAATGLTRPPASTKLRRVELVNDLLIDGTTKAWKFRGRQDLFVRGGTLAAPVLADFSLTGATGLIGEFMQTAAGLLSIAGTIVDIDIAVNRKTTATGTPTAALFIGSVEVARATFSANVNSVARICAKIVVLDANTQYVTFSAAPGAATNVTPGNLYTSINLNTALTWSVQISGAGTAADVHNVSMISVAVGAG